jgi:hypothetical protein
MTLTNYQHDIQITYPYAYQAILTLKKTNLLITCLIEPSSKLILSRHHKSFKM